MSRSIALILSTLFLATTVQAEDFTTYRNSVYKYAIIYPYGWTLARDDGKVFSVLNKTKDVNINVVAEELDQKDRGKYKKITGVPNMKQDLISLIKQMSKASYVESGDTVLSNEPAFWFKYFYIHRSLDIELHLVVYQLSMLKNEISYTLSAKVSALSRAQANTKFENYWPTIKTSMASFVFTDIVK